MYIRTSRLETNRNIPHGKKTRKGKKKMIKSFQKGQFKLREGDFSGDGEGDTHFNNSEFEKRAGNISHCQRKENKKGG